MGFFFERQTTECRHNPHGSYFKMEDGDSDEGGAGHLLTAWLGELDTLKKVRRISQLRDKKIALTEKILCGAGVF